MFSLSILTIPLLLAGCLAQPTSENPRLAKRALGINCRGSGLCPAASLANVKNVNIMQGLRDAIYSTKKPDNTMFNAGDHIICISTSMPITVNPSMSVSAGIKGMEVSRSLSLSASVRIGNGGICAFMQHTKKPTSLGDIKKLADKLLMHNCNVCGSVPLTQLQGRNDPSQGILTFNYVKAPWCVGNCLSAVG